MSLIVASNVVPHVFDSELEQQYYNDALNILFTQGVEEFRKKIDDLLAGEAPEDLNINPDRHLEILFLALDNYYDTIRGN